MAPTRVTSFAAIAAVSAALWAQQPPPATQAQPATRQEAPPVVLKATTRLIQLSVIARDNHGQPIEDLHQGDFQIKVNGKVQPIKVFSVESNGTLPESSKPFAIPPDVFTNRMEARQGSPSGVTIILIDTRNTNLTDQIYAKAQVIRYLRTLQPTEHIGIYAFGGTLRVLHDYTSDSADLLNRLAASKGKEVPDTSKEDAIGALQNDSLMLDSLLRGAGGAGPAERAFYTTDRVLSTLRAFEFIAQHLAQLPGRKNLIWVSGGFPLDIGYDNIRDFRNPAVEQESFTREVEETLRVMNDANIAVYPVDARGLMVNSRFSAANRSAPARGMPSLPVGVKEQQTMQEVASRTGGQAFYNTNDLTHAIRSAVDDSRVTYTIGFYPADDTFDGKFHKIDVETPGHSGVKLRYRKGFFDLPEQPQDEKTRRAELLDAVWSPIDASALGIIALVKPSADKKSLDVTLKIDHADISLQQGDNRWAGRLDVLLVQRDDQGTQYGGIDDTINMNLTQATFDKLLKDNLMYHQVVLRSAKAKMLRIVVRDAASGALGSVSVPLAKLI